MNDRYLFRAKRIDNNEWVEGFYALIGKKHVIISKEPEGYYTESTEERHGYEIVEVEPSTICQCTGLKDKDGKLIWENDIVFVTDDDGNSGQVDTGVGEVDFLEGLWYIGGNVQNALYDINKIHQIKVIGSIFDNPELLEQED